LRAGDSIDDLHCDKPRGLCQVQVRQDGVGYRVRRLGSAPFALAIFMVLGLGFVIAVDRNRAA